MPTVRRRAGLALMEAVIALAIVGMMAIGSLAAVSANIRTAERARRTLEASALATERLAQLDLLSELELEAVPDSVARGQFEAPLDGYRWTTEVTNRTDVTGLHDVVVRVSWSDGAFILNSTIFRRPLVVTR